jgi:hypothetical protein
MPLSLLSYASILGIIPTLYLIVVMFIDGFSKPEGLGSLWTPAETSLSFGSLEQLGMSFGLFMAGVSRFVAYTQELLLMDRLIVVGARRHTFSCARHGRS